MELKKAVSAYFADKPEVTAVYLFGSYAKNQQRHMSDIDLGILLKRNHLDQAEKKRTEYHSELSRILRKDIHIVVLNTAGDQLLKQIFNKGKCILNKDPGQLARYKMFMYSKIADFAFYSQKIQSGFIRKLTKGSIHG